MDQFLTAKRNPILFPKTAADFAANVSSLKTELKALIADNPESKDFYLKTAAGIAIDLRSYLSEWILTDLIGTDAVYAASDELLSFVKESDRENLAAEAEKEIASIRTSSVKKMCDMTKAGTANTGSPAIPARSSFSKKIIRPITRS